MNATNKLLSQLGLHKDEALVYGYLLDHGTSLGKHIIRGTKLLRPLTYRAINSLVDKNLVIEVKKPGKPAQFEPADPRGIRTTLNEVARSAEEQLKTCDGLLPVLVNLYNKTTEKPYVESFEGINEFARLHQELVMSGAEIYQMYDPEYIWTYYRTISERLSRDRVKMGVKKHILVPDTAFARQLYSSGTLANPQTAHDDSITERRLLQNWTPPAGVITFITQSAVLIGITHRETVLSVVIHNNMIATLQLSLFDQLWQRASVMNNTDKTSS